jgi:hypothetical protein
MASARARTAGALYHNWQQASIYYEHNRERANQPRLHPVIAADAAGNQVPSSDLLAMNDPVPSTSWQSPSRVRMGIALAIALLSDGLSFVLSATVIAEPLIIGIDLVTGILIWWALGRPMLLFAVFVAEAIPGIGMIPLWTLVVAILITTGRLPSKMGGRMSYSTGPNQPPSISAPEAPNNQQL